MIPSEHCWDDQAYTGDGCEAARVLQLLVQDVEDLTSWILRSWSSRPSTKPMLKRYSGVLVAQSLWILRYLSAATATRDIQSTGLLAIPGALERLAKSLRIDSSSALQVFVHGFMRNRANLMMLTPKVIETMLAVLAELIWGSLTLERHGITTPHPNSLLYALRCHEAGKHCSAYLITWGIERLKQLGHPPDRMLVSHLGQKAPKYPAFRLLKVDREAFAAIDPRFAPERFFEPNPDGGGGLTLRPPLPASRQQLVDHLESLRPLLGLLDHGIRVSDLVRTPPKPPGKRKPTPWGTGYDLLGNAIAALAEENGTAPLPWERSG